jgi:hypothetical protein
VNEESNDRLPIPGYCIGIEVGDLRDCPKVVDGCCTVFRSPCRKMGGSQNIGCAFSPLERPMAQKKRVRVGQQKQKKRR